MLQISLARFLIRTSQLDYYDIDDGIFDDGIEMANDISNINVRQFSHTEINNY